MPKRWLRGRLPSPLDKDCTLSNIPAYHDIPEEIMSGWWLNNPSEKYEFVSWDDDYPVYYGKQKTFETTNQM